MGSNRNSNTVWVQFDPLRIFDILCQVRLDLEHHRDKTFTIKSNDNIWFCCLYYAVLNPCSNKENDSIYEIFWLETTLKSCLQSHLKFGDTVCKWCMKSRGGSVWSVKVSCHSSSLPLSLWEFTTTPSDAVSLWAGDEERQATSSQYNRPLTFPLLSRLLTLKRGALPRNSVSSETTSLRERRRRKKFVDALKIWTHRMFVRINRLPVQFCAFFFFSFQTCVPSWPTKKH